MNVYTFKQTFIRIHNYILIAPLQLNKPSNL